jgi:ribosome-associated protein
VEHARTDHPENAALDAAPDNRLAITPALSIPRAELRFRFTRSGGPGGQHVNRTSSQVELTFDVLHSPALSAEQRTRLSKGLRRRIDSEGVLHLVSHATRSQLENRADVTGRFAALLASALKPVKLRKATRPTRAAREKRLESKKARGTTKLRRKVTARELE